MENKVSTPSILIEISWINILKMLYYRGYPISIDIPFQIPLYVKGGSKGLPSLLLFCSTSEKTDINDVKNYIKCVQQHPKNPKHAILIHQDSLTPSAKKCAQEAEKIKFEIHKLIQFYHCLVEYDLCPKHQIIKKKESKSLLEKYNLCPENLPKQSIFDPFSRFYGLKSGDLVIFKREYPHMEPQLLIKVVV